jgi:hypothetical protein
MVGSQQHLLTGFLQGRKQHGSDSNNSISRLLLEVAKGVVGGQRQCTSFLQEKNVAGATAATVSQVLQGLAAGQQQSCWPASCKVKNIAATTVATA